MISALYRDKIDNSRADIRLFIVVTQGDTWIENRNIIGNVKLRLSNHNVTINARFSGKNQSLLNSSVKGIKGIHKLDISVNATATNHAEVRSVEIRFEDERYNKSSVSIIPTKAGVKNIEVVTVDSRGLENTTRKSVEVLEYSPPRIDYTSYRSSLGNEDPIGNIGKITGNINYTSIRYSYGKYNQPWWKLDIDSNTKKNTSSIMYSLTVPVEETKTYTLTYGDDFSEMTVKGTIPSASVPLSVGKNSIGVGTVQPPNVGGVWIGGNSNINRSLNIVKGSDTLTVRFASGYASGRDRTNNGLILGERGKKGLIILSDSLWVVNVDTGGLVKKLFSF